MSAGNNEGDAVSEQSTTCYTPTTARFPLLSVMDDGGLWDGRPSVVPWPGNIYMIVETSTRTCITYENKKILLKESNDAPKTSNSWYCVEKDGYYGFQHTASGRFLGRNNERKIHAEVTHLKPYEMYVPRKHPEGGYQLMMPHDGRLRVMCVNETGDGLVDRDYGRTTWEFYKV
jgi:hypothetical protein